MKPRLLILSDMWGLERCAWIKRYVELLEPFFSIQLYDSCALGNVEVADACEEDIHAAFIHDGIETAVANLLKLEPKRVDVLAFSIGGSIAWEAALKGMDIGRLYAVSSTRLRLQTEKPGCWIQLFYGADDVNQPKAAWFEKLKQDPPHMEFEGHDFYMDATCTERICGTILADHQKALPY